MPKIIIRTTNCVDGTVNVNGNLFDTVASGGTLNVPVQYVNTTPVGTIVGGVVQIPNVIQTLNNKFIFDADDDTVTYTATADEAGTITSITQDGASGTIAVTINAVVVVVPFAIVATDAIVITRTVDAAAGWVKQTGTYT